MQDSTEMPVVAVVVPLVPVPVPVDELMAGGCFRCLCEGTQMIYPKSSPRPGSWLVYVETMRPPVRRTTEKPLQQLLQGSFSSSMNGVSLASSAAVARSLGRFRLDESIPMSW